MEVLPESGAASGLESIEFDLIEYSKTIHGDGDDDHDQLHWPTAQWERWARQEAVCRT